MLLLRTDMQVLGTFMKVKCPKVAKAKHGRDGTPIRGGWALVEGFAICVGNKQPDIVFGRTWGEKNPGSSSTLRPLQDVF